MTISFRSITSSTVTSNRYLGKQYRLKVRKAEKKPPEQIEIDGQFLAVYSHDPSPDQVKPLVVGWFYEQARQIFAKRLSICLLKFKRYDLKEPDFVVRKMTRSWGSCSAKNLISLNLKLIQVPQEFIDYVIFHELCHLIEHNHGPDFLKILNLVMPS